MILFWRHHPTFGPHSYHEYENLYHDDFHRSYEMLNAPDRERGVGPIDAFLVIFALAGFVVAIFALLT